MTEEEQKRITNISNSNLFKDAHNRNKLLPQQKLDLLYGIYDLLMSVPAGTVLSSIYINDAFGNGAAESLRSAKWLTGDYGVNSDIVFHDYNILVDECKRTIHTKEQQAQKLKEEEDCVNRIEEERQNHIKREQLNSKLKTISIYFSIVAASLAIGYYFGVFMGWW